MVLTISLSPGTQTNGLDFQKQPVPVGGAISTAQAQAFLGHLHQVREEPLQTGQTQELWTQLPWCVLYSLFLWSMGSYLLEHKYVCTTWLKSMDGKKSWLWHSLDCIRLQNMSSKIGWDLFGRATNHLFGDLRMLKFCGVFLSRFFVCLCCCCCFNLNRDTMLKGKTKFKSFRKGLYWPNSCQGSKTVII